ncbi:hypothetical protein C8J25_11717 [Sphingomonas faeni]|uniref:Uncharacterized protein n=1 Tax=Sphingomonas faeni TaxID=185950 RepID=A0A2T5TWH7_9SPHN|nr:hypothetical protein C8J25_11717 [Sphingomonas faeni]
MILPVGYFMIPAYRPGDIDVTAMALPLHR